MNLSSSSWASLCRAARRSTRLLALCTVAAMPQWAPAQTLSPQALRALAAEQVQPLLESLKSMVAIESGSRDLEGLAQMSDWLAKRLQARDRKSVV